MYYRGNQRPAIIFWRDAYAQEPKDAWVELEEVWEEPYVLWDIGFIIKETDEQYSLAQEFDEWSGRWRGITTIPKSTVIEITEWSGYERSSEVAKRYNARGSEEGTHSGDNHSATNTGRVRKASAKGIGTTKKGIITPTTKRKANGVGNGQKRRGSVAK